LELGLRACLWSRVASRVFLELSSFTMSKEEHLYDNMVEYSWEKIFSLESTFACRFTMRGQNPIINPRFASLKLKDAVADRFRKVYDSRPNVDRENPDINISGHWERDKCRIYIDLSGQPLSVRNYRKDKGIAPIRENLAAALLLRSHWPEKAKEGHGFWDPFCGSGTIVVEAALMAADQAPGMLRRRWGFKHWLGFDSDLWNDLMIEARERAEKGKENLPPMGGSDKDDQVLSKAEGNARRAGFNLSFLHSPLDELIEKHGPIVDKGLILTNPPYGQRLEERHGLEGLYKSLGDFYLEQLPIWEMAIITSERELSYATGLRAQGVHRFDNGSLSCELSHFSDPANHKFVFHVSVSGEQFQNRLDKNLSRIQRWAEKNEVSCYRIYDADLPDYNFALDFYQGKWINLQEYVPPGIVDQKQTDKHIREAIEVLQHTLKLPKSSIYVKQRKSQTRSIQYDRQDHKGQRFRIAENGCYGWTNFQDYLDTGIFLDHRPIRKYIKEHAKDTWFLNLFSYTATASVAAATGGASLCVSVDTSTTYLDWGKDNFRVNKIHPQDHEFIKDDAMAWLKKEKRSYHMIFVDPPTFSNNSTQKRKFDVQKDHINLLNLCYRRLRPGGTLIFSNNFRQFEMQYQCRDGEMEEVTSWSIPEDFSRGKRIHRCWIIKKPLKD
ncbi:MAG: bifunctional 23S rRNA (guanine(2069)-N(7))-methyltransferase RlmK/23S rRNA (guanine(2445)-N(2))-methyltransferase RlmL, partial [Spirochaetaceae bacterium]|nr:bifunctional 23S rRNA (guanine(2069)-N(7))-methyltransferase RlmK/23S rRNA (guanine(2445)-N(2))-methyltransferase RlmL [Spirochaetaceae bacterium]